MRKSNTIKVLCLLAVFVSAGFSAKAQLTNLEQSIFLNFNVPMSEFNDGIAANALGSTIPMTRFNAGKGASFGFGIGYRVSYRFDVGFGEVSPYLHGDFQWNRVDADTRDTYMNANDGSAPNYFNIPIYVGVNYRYQINDIFTPFAEFGIGPDFFFITRESGTISDGYDFKLRYAPSCNVAFQIGAGCYFGQHVSASVHYNSFGKHAIKYVGDAPTNALLAMEDALTTNTQTRSIGLLSMRIGFHF